MTQTRFLASVTLVVMVWCAAVSPSHAQLVEGDGSGLMNVQVINTQSPHPGNETANWLSIWNALDGGAGPTGPVAGFTIVNNVSDTEVHFNYPNDAAGIGNFSNGLTINTIAGDGPGGGPGPYNGPNDYSIRARAFLEFTQSGTYSLAMGSDDGRRIELTAAQLVAGSPFDGFQTRSGQVTGTFVMGDTVIGFDGGTGHNQTFGSFQVLAGDILELDAFYYQGGGGHSGELSIAPGAPLSFSTAAGGFELLQDGALNGAVLLHTSLLEVPVPEPGTIFIWSLLGLAAVGFAWRQRRRKAA